MTDLEQRSASLTADLHTYAPSDKLTKLDVEALRAAADLIRDQQAWIAELEAKVAALKATNRPMRHRNSPLTNALSATEATTSGCTATVLTAVMEED